MGKEEEFSEIVLSIKKVLEHLEFNNNILSYELGYVKNKDSVANIRMFEYRILPAIDMICDNIDELKLIKLKAYRLMADLQGQGRG